MFGKTLILILFKNIFKKYKNKYYSEKRKLIFMGFDLDIHPKVYHENYIEATKFLADIMITEKLSDKYLLEIGNTCGLISIFAAKKGAIASIKTDDDSLLESLIKNTIKNEVEIRYVGSNWDFEIKEQKQDFIIINPIHLNNYSEDWEKFSWDFTDNYEYFKNLFEKLPDIIHSRTVVWLPLDKKSPFDIYKIMANKNGLQMELNGERNYLLNDIFMFKIYQTKH